jgi:uncharacterized membrane protein YfcA
MLEIYQIILLICVGCLVGISMSFVGQTGQGIVIPVVLLITGDVLLAIAVSVLNDLITATGASLGYIRKKQYYLRKDIFLIILIALFGSFIGVFLLMTTPLGSAFGIFLPIVLIVLGVTIFKAGFPTSESLKKSVLKLTRRIMKNKYDDIKLAELEQQINEQLDGDGNEINGIFDKSSKLFYILAIIFGTYVGINSGMFGANSGFIITLILVMLYGYPLKKGVGTALILSVSMCVFTFIIYQVLGSVFKQQLYINLEITVFLGIGSFIVALIMPLYIQKLSAKTMGKTSGIIMLILGLTCLVFYFIS